MDEVTKGREELYKFGYYDIKSKSPRPPVEHLKLTRDQVGDHIVFVVSGSAPKPAGGGAPPAHLRAGGRHRRGNKRRQH